MILKTILAALSLDALAEIRFLEFRGMRPAPSGRVALEYVAECGQEARGVITEQKRGRVLRYGIFTASSSLNCLSLGELKQIEVDRAFAATLLSAQAIQPQALVGVSQRSSVQELLRAKDGRHRIVDHVGCGVFVFEKHREHWSVSTTSLLRKRERPVACQPLVFNVRAPEQQLFRWTKVGLNTFDYVILPPETANGRYIEVRHSCRMRPLGIAINTQGRAGIALARFINHNCQTIVTSRIAWRGTQTIDSKEASLAFGHLKLISPMRLDGSNGVSQARFVHRSAHPWLVIDPTQQSVAALYPRTQNNAQLRTDSLSLPTFLKAPRPLRYYGSVVD